MKEILFKYCDEISENEWEYSGSNCYRTFYFYCNASNFCTVSLKSFQYENKLILHFDTAKKLEKFIKSL